MAFDIGEPRSVGSVSRNLPGAAVENRNRISALAERQFGQVTWAQMRRRGLAKATISRAVAAGWLHAVHPRVYSIVSPSLMSPVAWHAAAILAGGPGAALCAGSAGWWAQVLAQRPARIDIAVTGDREPVAGVRWHRLNLAAGERCRYNRMPITSAARIPLDLAADLSVWDLKGVLAELEFRHDIGPEAVRFALRRGYPGAAKLRRALDEHTPQLAATRSELERAFVRFVDDFRFVYPEFNHPIGYSTVDAIYRDQGIVIELDGVKGHSGDRRVLRDHRRDLFRRADGLLPVRYAHAQLLDPRDRLLIEAELERFGVPRR